MYWMEGMIMGKTWRGDERKRMKRARKGKNGNGGQKKGSMNKGKGG